MQGGIVVLRGMGCARVMVLLEQARCIIIMLVTLLLIKGESAPTGAPRPSRVAMPGLPPYVVTSLARGFAEDFAAGLHSRSEAGGGKARRGKVLQVREGEGGAS